MDRISRSAPSGEFRVEVYHKDDKIDDALFVVRGYVSNSGTKDIVRDHFVDPVEICTTNPELEILSIEIEAPDGVKPDLVSKESKWHLSWSILKPKEKISFISVVKSIKSDIKLREIESSFAIVARLVDVKSGQIASDRFSPPAFLFGFGVFVILVGVLIYVDGFHPRDAILLNGTESEYFIQKDLSFKSCVIDDSIFYFSECKNIDPSGLDLANPVVERVRIGADKWVFWIGVPVGLLYALLFGFTAARPSMIRRLAEIYMYASGEGRIKT